MSWKIALGLAACALLVLAVLGILTIVQIRKTARKAEEFTSTLDRHLPAIRQNAAEIQMHIAALQAMEGMIASLSAESAGRIGRIRDDVENLQRGLGEDLIRPATEIGKRLSTVLAFWFALRGTRSWVDVLRRARG